MMTLDPQKYIDSDEALRILVDSGTKVEGAVVTVGFEEDGSIVSIDEAVSPSSTNVPAMKKEGDRDIPVTLCHLARLK